MGGDRRAVPGAFSLWAPVVAWMTAIFVASSSPVPSGAGLFPDKLVHAGIYGGLALLVLRALALGSIERASWLMVLLAVGLAGVYGVTDEIHQSFVPTRHADVFDLVADVAGASVAAVAARLVARLIR